MGNFICYFKKKTVFYEATRSVNVVLHCRLCFMIFASDTSARLLGLQERAARLILSHVTANVGERGDDVAHGARERALAVRDVPLGAEGAHKLAHFAQVVTWHAREQVMLNLHIQSAKVPIVKRIRVNIARRKHYRSAENGKKLFEE
jgi:hypothetical protein